MKHKKAIKHLIHSAIQNGELPGMNVLILKDQKEIFYFEDGYADLETRKPLQRNSIFRLYSMSKPVTAAAIMLLVQNGKLDLAAPVYDFLPGFLNQKVCGDRKLLRPVQISDLLNMTSGLVYLGNTNSAEVASEQVFTQIEQQLDTEHPMTTLDAANTLGLCPLAFQPGAGWQYGSSADVLGAVVEVVSETKFGDFLKQELFEPLDMPDTDFYVPAEKQKRLVRVYEDSSEGKLQPYHGNHLGIRNDMSRANVFQSGGAGLVSTIDDYAHFAQMLLNKGTYQGRKILSPHTIQFMTSPSLLPEQLQTFQTWSGLYGYNYNCMMRILQDPGRAQGLSSPGEYGWDGWLGCYMANCPADNLTILAMTQKTDTGTTPLIRRLRNLIFSGL